MRAPVAQTRASILVWTVLTIAILSLLGAEVLQSEKLVGVAVLFVVVD